MRVAIIGAGMAGLACALRLKEAGRSVTVFDKGVGPGGRMATRRVETALGWVAFDHGAQYFTARDPIFIDHVAAWESTGIVARRPAAGEAAWVGVPGMNAPLVAMAKDVDVVWKHRVKRADRNSFGWFLDAHAGGSFDAVIVAVPAEQAATLLAPHDAELARTARAGASSPCWTVMAAFAEPIGIAADRVRDVGIIGWAARNGSKPERPGPEAWVIQATPSWSTEHLEDSAEAAVASLTAALAQISDRPLPPIIFSTGHRWRYARSCSNDLGALWNAKLGLGAAGDWLVSPRVEGAWLSGRRLADRILGVGESAARS